MLSTVKNLLKRFLPIPARSSNQMHHDMFLRFDALERLLVIRVSEVEAQTKLLCSLIDNQSAELQAIKDSGSGNSSELALLKHKYDRLEKLLYYLHLKQAKTIFAIACVKDESDVIESFCRYTLSYCDGLIIYDDGSTDGTKEIVQDIVKEGLNVYYQDDDILSDPSLAESFSRRKEAVLYDMAGIAFNEYNADLVVLLDADEFLMSLNGNNPRTELELLDDTIEYRIQWRTYIYQQEPDDNTKFLPLYFDEYRLPVYEVYYKTVISKHQYRHIGARIPLGQHCLEYPATTQNNANHHSIAVHDRLVLAHFPLRSTAQAMKKITAFRKAHGSDSNLPDGAGCHLREMYEQFQRHGNLEHAQVREMSLMYAYNLAEGETVADISTITGVFPTTFCEKTVDLKYTDYERSREYFFDNEVFKKYRQNILTSKLYVETIDSPFSEDTAISSALGFPDGKFEVVFKFDERHEKIQRLRFDPSDKPVIIKIDEVILYDNKGNKHALLPYSSNELKQENDFLYFSTIDSNIYYDVPVVSDYDEVRFFGEIRRDGIFEDRAWLEWFYPEVMGKPLDLENPQTFTEKMQWLKLYDRKPVYTRMTDKYEARSFVNEVFSDKDIPTLEFIQNLGVWDRFDDIDFSKLPEQFVLKCTHDAGSTLVCKDKSEFDTNAARNHFNTALAFNYYDHFREWTYKDIKPRIIAEKYVPAAADTDYKVFTFSGEPKYIEVVIGRFEEVRYYNLYDTEWNLTDYEFIGFGLENPFPIKKDRIINKPVNFDRMLQCAKILAHGTSFLRVDFYIFNDVLHFGELTFRPFAGYARYSGNWDRKLGELIELPNKTQMPE